MIIIISPAKTLDFTPLQKTIQSTTPIFEKEADYLATLLNSKTPQQLSELLATNTKLTELSFDRFQKWNATDTLKDTKQAMFVYYGQVFRGLDATSMNEDELLFAQKHLRILSGLYGILKPLDKIRPHRLEMAARMNNESGKDLYAFWRDKVTGSVKEDFEKLLRSKKDNDPHSSKSNTNQVLINLASDEYASVINYKKLTTRIITPTFKDFYKGRYAIISAYSKRARGMMSRFIVQNAITDPENMKLFDSEGYYYNEQLTKDHRWIFTRG
jgi:cytoplasmic iron level regulating protein YaaA (DUF328/UPF0246 family)